MLWDGNKGPLFDYVSSEIPIGFQISLDCLLQSDCHELYETY